MGLFPQARPTPPEVVPTDTIVPLHLRDDVELNRSMCFDFTMRFDDVLNTDKLRLSVERLMEIGEWKKLGARLRLNSNGKLEYHIPEQYDAKRPSFTFDWIEHKMGIKDHPIASALPQRAAAAGGPTTFASPGAFDDLLRQPNTPSCLEDWIKSDRPQLDIYVVNFKDATMVRMTWLHTFMDAMGRASLLRAWASTLHGREDEVPPLLGFDNDPMATSRRERGIEVQSPEAGNYSKAVVGWFRGLLSIVKKIVEMLWASKPETRIICVPGWFVTEMRETAMQELAKEDASSSFISESDVLLAWWTRTMLHAINPPPTKNVLILNVFNIRPILSERFPPNSTFIGNALMTARTMLQADQILERPTSTLASRIRHSLATQRTKEHVEERAALQEKLLKESGTFALSGPPNTLTMTCSNRHQAKFFDLDFSPAVREQGIPIDQRANGLGKPSFILTRTIRHAASKAWNMGSVTGRDSHGDWWMAWTLKRGLWEDIERQFERFRRDV